MVAGSAAEEPRTRSPLPRHGRPAGARGAAARGPLLTPRINEYPPREDLLEVCRRGDIDGIVLVDLAGLGPDLAGTLSEARASRSRGARGRRREVEIHGGSGRTSWLWRPGSPTLPTGARRLRPDAPRRVCRRRSGIDMEEVRAPSRRYQARGRGSPCGCSRTHP